MTEITVTHGKDPETKFVLNYFGATVTSWKVKGDEQLFLSSKAVMDGTKAIRGGIPLCFPQFGPWENGRPQHGFARLSNLWKEKGRFENGKGDISLQMILVENEDTFKLWPYKFEFVYTITLTSTSLELEANIKNTGDIVFDFTFCFHTYLRVNDIADVSIKGLQSLNYIDKTLDGARRVEKQSEIHISEFVDRVYENSPDDVYIKTGRCTRVIHMRKVNLSDYVVWNPWSENCLKMSDLDDDGFKHMICVEAAQDSNPVTVNPGESWNARYSIVFCAVDANL